MEFRVPDIKTNLRTHSTDKTYIWKWKESFPTVSCSAVEPEIRKPRIRNRTDVSVESVVTPSLVLPNSHEGINVAKISNAHHIRSACSLAELCSVITLHVPSFSNKDYSHAVHRLTILYRQLKAAAPSTDAGNDMRQINENCIIPALNALLRHSNAFIEGQDAWDIALRLWALAQLNYFDAPVFRGMCERALVLVSNFAPVDCANVMWAFGKLRHYHPQLLSSITEVTLKQIEHFKPEELMNVMWGFARLRTPPAPRLIEDVLDYLHWQLDRFGSKELAILLWSMATLRVRPNVRLLAACDAATLARASSLKPQDIANTLWALQRMSYRPSDALLTGLAPTIVHRLSEFKPAELSSTLWAYTQARYHNSSLMNAAASTIMQRLDKMSNQDLAMAFWSFGTLKHHLPTPSQQSEFLDALCGTTLERVWKLRPQALGLITKALYTLRHRPEPELTNAICFAAKASCHRFKPQDLSNLLYGLAGMKITNAQVFTVAVRRMMHLLEDNQPVTYVHVESVVDSCAAAGMLPRTLIDYAESKGLRLKNGAAVGIDAEPETEQQQQHTAHLQTELARPVRIEPSQTLTSTPARSATSSWPTYHSSGSLDEAEASSSVEPETEGPTQIDDKEASEEGAGNANAELPASAQVPTSAEASSSKPSTPTSPPHGVGNGVQAAVNGRYTPASEPVSNGCSSSRGIQAAINSRNTLDPEPPLSNDCGDGGFSSRYSLATEPLSNGCCSVPMMIKDSSSGAVRLSISAEARRGASTSSVSILPSLRARAQSVHSLGTSSGAAAATLLVENTSGHLAVALDQVDLEGDRVSGSADWKACTAALGGRSFLRAVLLALDLGNKEMVEAAIINTPALQVSEVVTAIPALHLPTVLTQVSEMLSKDSQHVKALLPWVVAVCARQGHIIECDDVVVPAVAGNSHLPSGSAALTASPNGIAPAVQ